MKRDTDLVMAGLRIRSKELDFRLVPCEMML